MDDKFDLPLDPPEDKPLDELVDFMFEMQAMIELDLTATDQLRVLEMLVVQLMLRMNGIDQATGLKFADNVNKRIKELYRANFNLVVEEGHCRMVKFEP